MAKWQLSLGGARRWRPVWGAVALTNVLVYSGPTFGKDGDDDEAPKSSGVPNVYIDFRTNYAYVPAGSLSFGLGETSLFTALSQIVTLANVASVPNAPGRPALSSPTSQGVGVDVPLTVDLGEVISLYGGFTGSASHNERSGWSEFAVTSLFAGFQADVYQQNGGLFPTITLQTTVTRAVPDAPLATTSLNAIVEANYALDADETRGLLAGVQLTRVDVDSSLARVGSTIAGYVGGYHQWENNWKVTGRLGVQSFGGAQLLNLAPFQPFTQPLLRLDLDRMDDDDNRLFGVTAQIAWTPKPAYQLTIRTPLYATRN
jgi:hypothetical protein